MTMQTHTEAHTIEQLTTLSKNDLAALIEVLQDCVAGGASVSFMQPLSSDKARAFWQGVAASAAQGQRALFVTRDADGQISGTVQCVPAQPENQPHRADISKLLVHRRARRQGLGEALMCAAEAWAKEQGRHVLVLDTAGGGAEALYEKLGWQLCGTVPGYALMPDGALCATNFYYKHL
jgi:GNAT superfamily N-acetyltransferase